MIKILSAGSVCLIASAGVASADLTASQLWEIWRADGSGAVSAAMTAPRPDGLDLSGVSLAIGAQDNRTTVLIDRVTLTNTGDDTVRIALSDSVRVVGGGLPERAALSVSLVTPRIVADRDAGRIGYDISATELAVMLSDPGPQLPTLEYRLENLASQIETGEGLSQPLSATSSAESVTGLIAAAGSSGPTGESATRVAFAANSLTGSTEIDRPDLLLAGPNTETDTDASFRSSSSFADLRLDIRGESPQGPAAIDLRLAEGSISSDLVGGVFSSAVDTTGLTLGLAGSGLPSLPDALMLDTLAYSGSWPITPGQSGPVGLGLTLGGLRAADPLWAMFDPAGQLPRDPASFEVELTARGTPKPSLSGPDTAKVDAVPFDLELLDLRKLDLSLLGAAITGAGRVSQPTDSAAAQGQITLRGTGLLQLIGTLSAIGLLPPQQEMGARMGLAFATVPDPDGDGLMTQITFGPDGAVSLNGQQVR